MGYLGLTNDIAASNLNVQSQRFRVISQNMAGSDTEGYTQKKARVQHQVLGSLGAGVKVTDIARDVDKFLIQSVNSQTSVVSKISTINNILSSVEDLFGSPNSERSISSQITQINTALEKLSLDALQSVEQGNVVGGFYNFAQSLNSMSERLQRLRMDAESGIADSISLVNVRIMEVQSLNLEIQRTKSAGQASSELEDQRDIALKGIAEHMDIKWYEREAGDMLLMTQNKSRSMVDLISKQLSYSKLANLSADITYPAIISGIHLDGDDITTEIKGGKISGYIELRDKLLPDVQSQLDQLAQSFKEAINKVYNTGTSIPGIQTLTGTRTIDTTNFTLLTSGAPSSAVLNPDATSSLYGNLKLALIDANGKAVGTATTIDLDQLKADMQALPGAPVSYQLTLQDVMNAVNGVYATISTAGASVKPAGWTAAWPPASDLAHSITGLGTASGQAGPFSGNFARIINNTLEIGSANSAHGLAINDEQSTFSYGSPAETVRFNYIFGLNDLLVSDPLITSEARGLKVRDDILAAPSKLNRGKLATNAGNWFVATQDSSILKDMTTVLANNYTFTAIGGLSAIHRSFSGYAADIIATNAKQIEINKVKGDYEGNIKQELEVRIDSMSGVNMYEQFAEMISAQASYIASTHIIRTVQELTMTLMNVIK